MEGVVALLSESKKKLLVFLCEHLRDERLRAIKHIAEGAGLNFHTAKKIVSQFESAGLVRVYVVGRVRVVVPTEKLRELCDALKEH